MSTSNSNSNVSMLCHLMRGKAMLPLESQAEKRTHGECPTPRNLSSKPLDIISSHTDVDVNHITDGTD